MSSQPTVMSTMIATTVQMPTKLDRNDAIIFGLSTAIATPSTNGIAETMMPCSRPCAVSVRTLRSIFIRPRIVSEILSKISVTLPPVRRLIRMAVVTSVRSSDPTRLDSDSSASSKLMPIRSCCWRMANSSHIGFSPCSTTESNACEIEKPALSAFDIVASASGSWSLNLRRRRSSSHFASGLSPFCQPDLIFTPAQKYHARPPNATAKRAVIAHVIIVGVV